MNVSARGASLIGILAVLLAGCSSNDTKPAESSAATPPPAVVRDACELITAEEASKILGSATTVTKRSASAEKSVCDYVTQGFESVTVEAIWKGAEEEIKTARSSAKTATEAAGGKDDQVVADVMGLYRVDNLGDEAYFSRRTMSYVRKGDVLLVFQNAGLNEPAREHWEALARVALGRLQ